MSGDAVSPSSTAGMSAGAKVASEGTISTLSVRARATAVLSISAAFAAGANSTQAMPGRSWNSHAPKPPPCRIAQITDTEVSRAACAAYEIGKSAPPGPRSPTTMIVARGASGDFAKTSHGRPGSGSGALVASRPIGVQP